MEIIIEDLDNIIKECEKLKRYYYNNDIKKSDLTRVYNVFLILQNEFEEELKKVKELEEIEEIPF